MGALRAERRRFRSVDMGLNEDLDKWRADECRVMSLVMAWTYLIALQTPTTILTVGDFILHQ